MVGFPFLFKDKEVRYQTGNPMGAYSSWSSFALAHHFVVYRACRKIGIAWNTAPYCLLGDDIVLGTKDLGEAYKEIISELGISISEPKTHVSKHMFEFAKRYFFKGEEVTPAPISGILTAWKSIPLLVAEFRSMEIKGILPRYGLDKAVQDLYRRFGCPSSFRRRQGDMAVATYLLTEGISRRISCSYVLSYLGKKTDPEMAPKMVTEEYSSELVFNAFLMKVVSEISEVDTKLSFGSILLSIRETLAHPRNPMSWDSSSPERFLPLWSVHDQIERKLSELMGLVADPIQFLDSIQQNVEQLRHWSVPLSDEAFIVRKHHQRFILSHKILPGLLPVMEYLAMDPDSKCLRPLEEIPIIRGDFGRVGGLPTCWIPTQQGPARNSGLGLGG